MTAQIRHPLQKAPRRRRMAGLGALALAGLALAGPIAWAALGGAVPAAALSVAGFAAAVEGYRSDPYAPGVGRIYHYERSNLDGSRAERVSVFRKSPTVVEVYKASARCQPASWVMTRLDLDIMSPVALTGARLMRGAAREPFAFMRLDPESRTLSMKVDLPGRSITDVLTIGRFPWHLYDSDLASLTVLAPHLSDPREGFGFDLARVVADPEAETPLRGLGRAEAQFEGMDSIAGRSALRFTVALSTSPSDPADGDETVNRPDGRLWLDSEYRHILLAEFETPNQVGYDSFKLSLLSFEDGGQPAWQDLLLSHFEGCPQVEATADTPAP